MASQGPKTKDWFKNQLITHGVPLPSSGAKKEEYQRLYEEQVLPHQGATEFSSDDDSEQVHLPPQSVLPRAPSVAKSTKTDKKKVDALTHEEKRVAWVDKMTDQNVYDALVACQRTPGPIVDSTRDLYRKMLLEVLNSEESAVEKIVAYLASNSDVAEQWQAGELDTHGTNGVTNGNSENGFSDTDDEEAVETASRASRSSRASSKRATPARTPRSPNKATYSGTPTSATRSHVDSDIRSRRATALAGDEFNVTNDVDATDATRGISHYSSVASPGFSKSKSGTRRRVVETYEESHSYRGTYGTSTQPQDTEPVVVPTSKKRTVFYFILLIIVAVLGYVIYNANKPTECTGPECDDEIDIILKELDEGVQQDTGNGAI